MLHEECYIDQILQCWVRGCILWGKIHYPMLMVCTEKNEEIYMCIVSVWNTMSEVTVDLLEKPCALPLYSCKQSFFFFIFFLLIVISLQIMEAMALHLESSYEKLYRWSQGEPVIPLLEQNYFCQWSIQTCSWNFLQLLIAVPHNSICKIHWTLSPALTVILLQIVMVSLGTHPVKNHESQSRTSESQFRKTRSTKLKILGPLQCM